MAEQLNYNISKLALLPMSKMEIFETGYESIRRDLRIIDTARGD
jgi:hypothetical protein